MKKIFLFFIIIFQSVFCNAQPAFHKEYVSGIYNHQFSLNATADSGFILTGQRRVGLHEIFVVKTDVSGDTLWTRSFVDTTGFMVAFEAFETTDGGFLIGGRNLLGGTENFFIIRTDNNGNILWTKSYDGLGDDDLISMIQTTDNGFLLTGYTTISPNSDPEIFLVKIDSTGGLQWSKTYGNTDGDLGEYAIQAPDGGYYITGAYTEPVIPFEFDFILMKTDSLGNLEWVKTYGGTDGSIAEHLIFTNDGGILITGRSYGFGAGNSDYYIIKTDLDGNLQWANAFGWTQNDYGWRAYEDSQGYLVAGTMQDTINLQNHYAVAIHIDQQGNLDWASAFSDSVFSEMHVANCADGGYGFGFSRTTNGSTSGTTFSLVKTDAQLNFTCSQSLQLTESLSQPIVQIPVITTTSLGTVSTIPLVVSTGATVITHCPGTGLEEANPLGNLLMFPNPSMGMLQIANLPKGKIVTATILDNTGRTVYESFSIYDSELIDVLNLEVGYYFIRLEVDGFMETRKVAILR